MNKAAMNIYLQIILHMAQLLFNLDNFEKMIWQRVVGKWWPCKYVCTLITRIYEYVTIHGKNDLTNVTKVKDVEVEKHILVYQGGPYLI